MAASRKAATGAKASAKSTTTKASKDASIPVRASRAPRGAKAAEKETPTTNGVDHAEESSSESDAPAPEPTKKAPAAKKAAAPKKPTAKAVAAEKAAAKKASAKKPATKKAAHRKAAPEPAADDDEEEQEREEDDDEAQDEEQEAEDEEPVEAPAAPSAGGRKRKAADSGVRAPVVKRVRTAAVPKAGKPINKAPTDVLDIFVFGEGTSGELGLGSRKYDNKKPIDVKRPRINHNLAADKVGVVQIACGGMHVVALTRDDKILTWGVNDDRALGRDTTWDGGVRDVDADSDDEDDDDTGLNPNESTPGEVDFTDIKLEGTKFVQVVATDSASFVLTEDGRVYGWGTFRGSDGIIGFSDEVRVQQVPIMIDGLKSIEQLAAGANHVLARDADGKVFTWGSGGQYQLGRKAITRGKNSGLKPEPCGRFTRKHYAVDIAAGSYHSFYVDNHSQVWAWGLNNYSQTGHSDDTGKDDAMVLVPRPVEALYKKDIVSIAGGEHHSVAATKSGDLLTWGRVDGHQVGHPRETYTEENAVFDESGKPRILAQPTAIQDVKVSFVAAGVDSSFALTDEGQVYSWGFSANYQTGQGTTDDIEVPTIIDNTAIRDRTVTWAGAGGQYSILAAQAEL